MRPTAESGVLEAVELSIVGPDVGTESKTEALTPKFWASIALGVCVIQSAILKVVPVASKLPSSNTRRYSFSSSRPMLVNKCKLFTVEGYSYPEPYGQHLLGNTKCRRPLICLSHNSRAHQLQR